MVKLLTPRFTMTQISKEDWSFFRSLQTNPEIMYYVADRTEEEIYTAFESRLPFWTPNTPHWLCLVIKAHNDEKPLGLTGFGLSPKTAGEVEVGYMIAPSEMGQGIASETLSEVVRFAFETCQLHALTAYVTAGNTASAKVLEKNGFHLDQVIPDNYPLRGQLFDDWIFRLEKPKV